MTFYQSGSATGSEDPLLQALRWRTVYESASAATPRNRLKRAVRRNGDLLSNSGSLMATSVLTSALGFAYWWVAARLFPADAVGSVSAAVSAMTLVGTLGMFGMGTLLISELPRMAARRWNLISTCLLVSGTVAAVGGIVYEILAYFLNPGLRSSLGSPVAAVLLLVGMSVNAATLVLDEGLVGLLRGRLQLMRNAYFAVGKLVLLVVLAVLPVTVTGTHILATWVAGIFLSVGLLALSLRTRGRRASVRPDLSLLRGLGRHALDHNLLNLALFLPRTMLPLVVTAVLSTSATAAFYTAWMVLSVLAMIPGNVATTLFAVASGDGVALRGKMRMALLVSLGIGMPVSLMVALLARPIMMTFGERYAATASTALSVLALTFVATVVRQLFVAVSRLQGRARQASVYALLAGAGELVAAWYGASHGGLTNLALWVGGVFMLEGVVMAPAVLRAALGTPRSTASPTPASPAAPPRHVPPPVSPPPVYPPAVPTRQRTALSEAPTIQFRLDDGYTRQGKPR
ncbi:lipopolysaccharide biosynthesis protein [Planosporangium sp. 12N6]|uniref:lipopolysaccharide biosynthesis protein n=1 Tax=Planosporangium spinosum TaxID=3402278 RepID=UPI003CF56CDA